MDFTNREKELLLSNAPVLSRIHLYDQDGSLLQVFNENDYLVDWDYEDFRYVPDQGFIGQFVERLLDGHLMNIPEDLSLDDKEIDVEIAVVDPLLQTQVYHNYGRFMITKVEQEDTTGSYKFESSDYTKKFNVLYKSEIEYPCQAIELLSNVCSQAGVEMDDGKNLFDMNNANILNAYFAANTTTITANTYARMLYIECKPNTTYTISKLRTSQFDVACTDVLPEVGVSIGDSDVGGTTGNYDGTTIVSVTYTTNSTAKYLLVRYTYETHTASTTVLPSIQIEESETPSQYEPYKGYCYCFTADDQGLNAGNYYIKNEDTYYNFALPAMNYKDSIMLIPSKSELILRTIDENYNVIRTNIHYRVQSSTSYTELQANRVQYMDFINNDFVIEDNQFEEQDSCRNVVVAIAKLGYSWARINERNKLVLDFVKKTESDSETINEVNTDKYYEATVTGDDVQPVNKVVIGMSDVDGENIVNGQDADEVSLVEVQGETSQQTYSGKNLLDLTTNAGSNQVTVVADYEVAIINGTSTGNSKIDIGSSNLSEGTYTIMAEYLSGAITNPEYITAWCYKKGTWGRPIDTSLGISSSNPRTYATFTLTSEENICYGLYLSEGRTFNNVKIRVSIVKGSTPDYNFERFVGGHPSPNPDFPQDIHDVKGNNIISIKGKNLFKNIATTITKDDIVMTNDGENISFVGNNTTSHYPSFTFYANGDVVTSSWWASTNDSIKDEKGYFTIDQTNYVLSLIKSGKIITSDSIVCHIGWETTTTRFFINNTNNVYTQSVAPNDEKINYISIGFRENQQVDLSLNIQLEKGTTNTTYKPYVEEIYPIDLPVENLFDYENTDNYVNSGNSNLTKIDNGIRIATTVSGTNRFASVILGKIEDFTGKTFSFSCNMTPSSTNNPAWTLFYMNSSKSLMTEIGNVRRNNFTYTIPSTIPTNAYYLALVLYNNRETYVEGATTDFTNIQVEHGNKINTYVPYELVPIGYNLFDKNNAIILNGITYNNKISSSETGKTTYCECKPNTIYTISKTVSSRFQVCTTQTLPEINTPISNHISDDTASSITIKTDSSARYLCVYFYRSASDTLTERELLNSIRIEEGLTSHGNNHAIELDKMSSYQNKIFKTSGKNILPVSTSYTETKNDVTLSYNNGIFTMNGTPSERTNFQGIVKPFDTIAYKKYTINVIYVSGSFTGKLGIYNEDSQGGWWGYDIEIPEANCTQNNSVSRIHTKNLHINSQSIRAFENSVFTNYKFKIQVVEGDADYEYEPPNSNNEWFEYKETNKITINTSQISLISNYTNVEYASVPKQKDLYDYNTFDTTRVICSSATWKRYPSGYDTSNNIGIITGNANKLNWWIGFKKGTGLSNIQEALKECYIIYPLDTPEYNKITYQPLIDQLNAIQDQNLFNGVNHITIEPNDETPTLKVLVKDIDSNETTYEGKYIDFQAKAYESSPINIFDNPLTHSEELRRIAIDGSDKLLGLRYTPMEVDSIGHPWLEGNEFIKVTNLEDQDLYFYPFDRKITYKGYIENNISSKAQNQTSQKYENKNTLLDRMHHTEIDVDKANGQITLVSEQTEANSRDIANININVSGITQSVETITNTTIPTINSSIDNINGDIDDINGQINTIQNTEITNIVSRLSQVEQTAEAITNMFQITGGINVIRNSAFLLTDALWEFTNSGTNPYYTPLGTSYNSTLSGTTTSVAEIKLRSVKVKSKSENITNLKSGTKYTFNFYHQQDNNMTTTIKMYSTENNSSKAFNDIVITGQQAFKNYEISFTPTTYSNYTLEIIVSSSASVGYAYLYDMMLNSGDKQSWQPASDEIYSTTLTMSRLGLQVYSVGDGTITLLGSEGLLSYETSDGRTRGRLISKRTVDGDLVISTTAQNLYLAQDITQVAEHPTTTPKWVTTVSMINGRLSEVKYLESGGQ